MRLIADLLRCGRTSPPPSTFERDSGACGSRASAAPVPFAETIDDRRRLRRIVQEPTAELLRLPDHVSQVVLTPVAYFEGETFKPATRPPVSQVLHLDRW